MWTSFIYSFDDFKYNVIFVDHCTKYIWFYLSAQISFFNDLELTTPTQALEDPIWHRAMSNEYDALVQNSTWELVPLEPKHNLVRCNWIFHIKCLSDGSVPSLLPKDFNNNQALIIMIIYSCCQTHHYTSYSQYCGQLWLISPPTGC